MVLLICEWKNLFPLTNGRHKHMQVHTNTKANTDMSRIFQTCQKCAKIVEVENKKLLCELCEP